MTSVLHHRTDGPADAPVLILGPSLGTSLAVWDAQVPALARRHRVIRYDLPGHGATPSGALGSTAPGTGAPGALTPGTTGTGAPGTPAPGATPAGAPDAPAPAASGMADLAALVLDLADRLGVERFAYAGISLGGAVGAHLAVHHPERVTRLALVCSSARFGEPDGWHERAALVREKGTTAVAPAAPGRWFTPDFAGTDAAGRLMDDLLTADPEGYAACCDALAAYDLRDELSRITAPTLVLAGRADPATPPAHARELADGIPDASLLELAGAAHLAPAERPEAVLSALLGHFGAPDSDDSRYAEGMAVRRAVLGDAHVDRAVARTTDFTADFQDYITRCAWGEIWTRPGLDRRTRSCLTLTALIAHGHQEELALHVRAAIRNGLTPEDIKEVLLHSAVYCGVPAANSAFATAQRVLAEDGTPLSL
ncbi:4-carboxymuconolactone decarboxylase [Streptomyces sp. NPDC053253]|uniref:bifunctional 3-oxoadipate enol-lactonase/4-carboxymuconolactone decarboxylase PcaDC n=1 Tax=Streptomyces sp. NPDC053253 TaxID=3365699 RepID=UPI0037CDA478